MTINLDQYTNTLSVTDTATNADLNVTTKGTGSHNLNTGGGTQFSVTNTASATNYFATTGSNGGTPALYSVGASTNIGANFVSKGTGALAFYTNSSIAQLAVAHTASAVNYVQVTGAATGGSVVIYGNGSDTNVSTTVSAKGFSSFINFSAAGTTDYKAFAVSTSGASNTGNYLQVKGNASGTAPVLSAQGADTNVDITFTTKGTGVVQFGTHTATADTAISGYITIKDSGGTLRKLAVIT